jgi:flagellar hook-associated protein 3 FlgL
MSLRTPTTDLNRQSLLNLQNVQAQMAQNTLRLSSGNQITSPGDDPTGSATILDFQNSIQANTQFLQQASSANNLLQSAADAFTGAIDGANNLQVLAQQALSNTTSSAAGPASLAPQVDAIRTNLLSLANTQYQGMYVFAGAQTTTKPFTNSGLTYNNGVSSGPSDYINLYVSPTSQVATNIPGDTAFGTGTSGDLFKAVNDLYDAVNGNGPSGNSTAGVTADVTTASTELTAALNNLYQQQAVVGGRQAGLNDLQASISGINLSLQSAQSSVQSTNFAQTYTDLTSEQTAQQAILSTMAKTNTNNLFNYLT